MSKKLMTSEQALRLLAKKNLHGNVLRRILYRAPEPCKARAWKRLRNEDPSKLRGVLYSADVEYRNKAAARMIQAGVGWNTIFMHAPSRSRIKAAQVILEQNNPKPEDLSWVIKGAPEPFRLQAWKKFCTLSSEGKVDPKTRADLVSVFSHRQFPLSFLDEAVKRLIDEYSGFTIDEVSQLVFILRRKKFPAEAIA